ncbi:hypothetical protein LEP1GSC202_0327 [Leptospira yanagawae serovar Saopaulo str. Sao Paulo = ATCC 700523]|uniref:Uncharacterized protein n=1 Tax=Leptospira yanagawae serovar Saopaulo str. Sao Paulo = ATCC 700523 TaxID=1249483 RepID=A0A5E8HBD1_9LEPT|nr:hypothetical protein [Leptospira yanagawae]EOQ88539.1 hypothetical protein LEP1GSC202_0327 [Leptospira yanagawae serovar Saopaulo str. Sao Paulo = ATCC 700523]
MKVKLIIFLTYSIIFSFISYCDTPSETDKSFEKCSNVKSDIKVKYTGVYKYVYEDGGGLDENHHIILEDNNGKIRGFYFGTSDDFDQAREGYLPGYFAKEMENICLDSELFTFTIKITESDLFDKPIPLSFKFNPQNIKAKFKKWGINPILRERNYKGNIKTNKIILSFDKNDPIGLEKREFSKIIE